jgi:Ca-activated chloride channel family protein
MRLAAPYALLLLLALPLLLVASRRRQQPAGIGYPSVLELARLSRSPLVLLRRGLPLLRALVLALAILALARPQWGVEATKVYREGIAIAMVVDVSSSMAALDMPRGDRQSNRLDAVKATFRAFVEGDRATLAGRDGDLIGMIVFARYADTVSPLTLDHRALLELLDQVELVALADEDGTAVGDAIMAGVDRLRQAAGASRVMILLTDGSHNAGEVEPLAAARVASALGIKIYTIGAGSRGIALMPVRARSGGLEYRPAQVFIDEHTLEQIASLTGGHYFRATDADVLGAIYAEIDRLETATNVAEHYQRYIEAFPLALLAALALLVLEVVLVNTRLRTVP